jgi:hypothetical protein
MLQPGNTEDFRKAAAKAINRVLGKEIKPGLNLLHTLAAKKTPLHKKSSAEMAAKMQNNEDITMLQPGNT